MPGLSGTYFYAEFCSGRIASFRYANGTLFDWRNRTPELRPAGSTISLISSFGEDGDGELYIVSLEGSIYKIVPASGPVCGNLIL